MWSYAGTLVDPTNGRIVAEVEGIELTRNLAEVTNNGANADGKDHSLVDARGWRRMGSLKARDMLLEARTDPNEQTQWDYATTVLSRRMFAYRAPPAEQRIATANGKDSNQVGGDTRGADANNRDAATNKLRMPTTLLRSIRFRPNSPVKKLDLTDTVAVYDTATTYISRDHGRSLVVLTEFGDGRWVMGSTEAAYNGAREENQGKEGGNIFEYGVYARMGWGGRGGGTRTRKKNLPSLVPIRGLGTSSQGNATAASGTGSVIISPPRSRLIQFGKDNSVERARYGARETYSFENLGASGAQDQATGGSTFWGRIAHRARTSLPFGPSSPSTSSSPPTVRYTRYGESPPWYRPSQPATLELRGKRIDSFDDAPPLIASLADRYVPGLLAVDCPIPTESQSNQLGKLGKKQKKEKGGDVEALRKMQEEADAAAVRAVEWFRDPSSNGGEIVTLLEDTNLWDHDQLDDPFGDATKWQRAKRRVERLSRRAVKKGTEVAGRVWDATSVKSTSSVVDR